MMKRIFLIALMLFVAGQIQQISAQSWVWEKGFGGSNDDEGMSIATDPAGYVYVTGKFQSTSINFGSITLTNSGQIDIFIAKFTPTGNVVWAKGLGGTGDDIGRGIAVDRHGNVSIIGTFTSPTITVNATILTNVGTNDFIMVHLDSAGNYLWAKSAGGTNQDYGYCVATDPAGSIYFGGYYTSSSITFGTFVLPGGGQSNIAIAKYDTLGNCIWAKHPTGRGFLYSLATDNFGHVFLGGTIRNAVDFGNSVTCAGGSTEDPFIAKFDTSGLARWAKNCTGSGSDWGEAVATDPVGNAYFAGSYASPSLTVGSVVLSNAGSYDYFLAKYDSTGNVLWAKRAGGTADECPFGLCTDHCWNVFITGVFTSPSMVVGNTTLVNPGASGTNEMFVAKYDSSGAVMWAKRGGGTNEDYGYAIASDTNNYVYNTGGYASDSVSYGTDTLRNHGNYDVYLGRIGVSIKSSFATSDTVVCFPKSVTFTNLSVNGNTFLWNFGDGSTSNTVNPVHSYADTGTYTITLLAVNNTPCGIIRDSLKLIKYIKVKLGAATAFVADTTIGCNPLNVHFTNNSTNATTYHWDFGDGNTSTLASPTHNYTTNGSFTVTLIGYNPNGCNDSTIINNYINVSTVNSTSSFTADSLSGCLPVTINFTNTSTNGTSYHWNFGDGDTSSAFNPTHIYIDSGTFIVTLTTYNTGPCGIISHTYQLPNPIVISSPVALKSRFTTDSLFGCYPLSVKLNNQSINATNFYWNFGDGATDSITRNPSHIFNDTGVFHIVLIATNPNSKCVLVPDTTSFDIDVLRCEELYFPNVFTPNNDGYNDYFNVSSLGYTNYHLLILNRWGEKVFESQQEKLLWDGYNQSGVKAPDGTYYYIFTALDFSKKTVTQKGFITLIR